MSDGRNAVARTPLSDQGRSLQTGFVSADRGLASALADLQRPSNYAKILNILQMWRKRGIWSSLGIGWTRHRAGSFNSGATFLDFAIFVDSAGAQTLVFQVGDDVFSYNTGTQTETTITGLTSLSTTKRPCMRNFSPSTSTAQPILIYTNGDIEPRKVTTTSASSALAFNAGTWPGTFNSKTYSKPKFCEPYGDRMVFAGFPDTDTAFDVLISELGDAEDFVVSVPVIASDAIAFTYPAILGPLRGIRQFKLTNQSNDEVIIGGCTNGFFVITGSNATNYAMKILTRDYGLLSNRAWVQRDNDLIFPATDGFRTFAGLIENANLIAATLSNIIKDKYNDIDFANGDAIHAFHNPRTQEIQFWLPITGDGGQCKHALILNYNNDETGPNGTAPIWSTKDGISVAASINFNNVVYGGGYDGLLQVHYSGNFYDTTPIQYQYRSALFGLSVLQSHRSYEHAVICDGGAQKVDLRPFVYELIPDTGQIARVPGEPNVVTLESGVAGGTVLDSWELGIDAFPSDGLRVMYSRSDAHGLFQEVELSSGASADYALEFNRVEWIISGGGLQR